MPFQPCPKCKKSVHTTFKHCPFCGAELSEASAQFSADKLSQLFGTVDTGSGGIHWRASNRLREMGERLGYQAYSDYGIPSTVYRSRIDAVWFSGGEVVAAFAVHSKRRNLGIVLGYRDREALASIQAQEKFFVNVSTTTGKAHFHKLRADSSIEYAQVSGEEYSYIEDTRKTYPRAFEAWALDEDELLVKRFREGSQISELADIHQRTPWSIQIRLESLGLLPPHIPSTRRRTRPSYDSAEEMKTYDVDEIRKKHPKAYEGWTNAEDAELVKNYRDGLSISELAERHERKTGAILSRLRKLEKLGLIKSKSILEGSRVEETRLVTFLVKSEKHGKICLACVDESRQWVRPIKPGGFDERDILMDNGKTIQLFDVVNMKFGTAFPIKHQKENVLSSPHADIRFVRKLGENERSVLLSEMANDRILSTVRSREELYDELSLNLKQSLVLAGPANLFEIQCNIIGGKTHPRIWIVRPNDKQRVFSITCTDIRFCEFIGRKIGNLEQDDGIIGSQDIAELKGKQTYFVIGLTGDSLDENSEIRDGKYAPPGSSIEPRYWPMVVSVLTVPEYFSED